MKLRKGSPEAKKFMSQLRAKKKKSIGISRSQKQYNKEVDLYKYFVVDIKANRVISGWEYLEDAKDSIEDYQEKTNYKIVPKSRLKNLNLNNSYKDWIINERKSLLGGWAKGNTRMIEMNEKPFKKLKNVRVKRTKDGVFNKFKVIPNMEQFIRDKRSSLNGDIPIFMNELNLALLEYQNLKTAIEFNKKNIANKGLNSISIQLNRVMLEKNKKLILLVKKQISKLNIISKKICTK